MTHVIPESPCPACAYPMNRADNVHGPAGAPEVGSLTLCLNCGQLLVFDAPSSLRMPTREEISEVMADSKAWEVIEKSQYFIKERGPIRRAR